MYVSYNVKNKLSFFIDQLLMVPRRRLYLITVSVVAGEKKVGNMQMHKVGKNPLIDLNCANAPYIVS